MNISLSFEATDRLGGSILRVRLLSSEPVFSCRYRNRRVSLHRCFAIPAFIRRCSIAFTRAKQVFMEGSNDFYGDEFGDRYLDLMNVKYGRQKTLDSYDIGTIALSPLQALASTCKVSRVRRVVFDGVGVEFRRTLAGLKCLPVSLSLAFK